MESLKKYIYKEVAKGNMPQAEAKKYLLELLKNNNSKEDIAIIGVACKFPCAEDKDEFWNNIKAGRDCIIDFPEVRKEDYNRFLMNPYYCSLLLNKHPKDVSFDNIYTKGGYLKEIDKFDAKFFRIPPKEATYMDPQQRNSIRSNRGFRNW